ncbi:hypothetical protein GCM10029978_063770 [Actinoallomurus acanthiterrae]
MKCNGPGSTECHADPNLGALLGGPAEQSGISPDRPHRMPGRQKRTRDPASRMPARACDDDLAHAPPDSQTIDTCMTLAKLTPVMQVPGKASTTTTGVGRARQDA